MIRILLSAVLALTLALGWSLWRAEIHKGDKEAAEVRADALADRLADAENIIAAERDKAAELAAIGSDHEQDRQEAESVPATVVAGLGDGSIVLRKQWAACETNRLSETASLAAERDALAELRRKDQGDLVRVGRDANDHVAACQAVVRAYEAVRQ